MDILVLASRNGYCAFTVGRPITACPRGAISDPELMAWRAGWRQARDEHEEFHGNHHDDD